ncbi:MAG: DNA-processing protein DprA [Gemmatimonadota bacterium]
MDPLTQAAETRALLALASSEGVGPVGVRRLLEHFGSAHAALAASRTELEAVPRLARRRLEAVHGLEPAAEADIAALASRGIRLAACGCDGYPERLTHLYDPPPVLFLRGPGELPVRASAAIVGTRRATEYGRRMARDIAAGLAEAGWAIVSGLAVGIDSAAHRAALDAGGRTVAVLGCGLDRVYPARNRSLYAEMTARGLLASEFPPHAEPNRGHFPRRNRIIAALAEAVIVVQAPRRSGALITVGHANDLGRAVFGVPGPVGPPASEGVHALLRDGASFATSAADVIEAMPPWTAPLDPPAGRDRGCGNGPRGALRETFLTGLEHRVRTVEALARDAGCGVGAALAELGRLEVEGTIRALPGGRFERVR